MIKQLKKFIKTNALGKKIFYDTYHYLKFISSKKEQSQINERISNVRACPDNDLIPRVADAGKIQNGCLIMHNGLKVDPLSYYGHKGKKLLVKNRGLHEPQEEKVFAEVLKDLPENAVMLELGSYWAFYSIWFNSVVKNARCFMIEPHELLIRMGMKNFHINNMKGVFYHAFAGAESGKNEKGEKIISVDDFIEEQKIDFIHILHSDIQGFELDMLKGAKKLIERKKVGYFFISTHSNELHNRCIEYLSQYGFILVASANMDESYSYDGLIVMRAPYFAGIDKAVISLRGRNDNLARAIFE